MGNLISSTMQRAAWLPPWRERPERPAAILFWGALLGAVAATVALAPVPLTASLFVAAAIVLSVLVWPWTGLPLLAVAIPFASAARLPLGALPVDLADLLLLLIVSAWLAQGVVRRHIAIPRAPLNVPLAVFALALALSLPGATSFGEALPELLKWVQVTVLYWCVVALLPAPRAGWVLGGVLLAGAAQALLGLYQFFTQTGPEAFVLMDRFMRASGTFFQPNPYAGYLGLVAPLAIALSLWAWTAPTGRPRLWLRLLLPAVALVICAGLLVSWSRGAWLGFGTAALATVVAYTRRAAPALLLIGGLVLLTALAMGAADLLPVSIAGRLGDLSNYLGLVDVQHTEVTDDNFAVIERVAHWWAATAMWAERPWLGVGIGNYAVAYPSFALPRWDQALGHAHNVYLNFGAETGLVGLVAYLVLWAAMIWQAVRAAAARHWLTVAVGVGVLGGLVHATVHNFFDNLWVQHVYLELSLLLGLVAVLLQASPAKPSMDHA